MGLYLGPELVAGSGGRKIVTLTRAEYDALAVKEANTIYYTTDDFEDGDYGDLKNLPRINGRILTGDMTGQDLGILKVEYLVNTDTTGANNTTAFATSAAGVLCPNQPAFVEVRKRVQASKPLADAVLIVAEFRYKNEEFFLGVADQDRGRLTQNKNKYGIQLNYVPNKPTQLDVTFSIGGGMANQEYGANGLPWGTDNANGHKWRVLAMYLDVEGA